MNIQINKEMNKLRNSTLYKGCIHRDEECNGLTSKAHSIQHRKILDEISVDGEVVCIDFGKMGLSKDFKLVGTNKASIFTGFCNYHDGKIFSPIENYKYELNNKEQNFLFAYRAFALGYYERYSAYEFRKAYYNSRQYYENFNRDMEYKTIRGYEIHFGLIEKIRTSMNTNLDNKRFDRIYTEVLVWPQNFGLAATSMFFIEKDNEGRVVNSSSPFMCPFFFTIFPQDDVTFVLMSCLSKDKGKYEFIKRQIVEADMLEQKILISNIIAMNIENFFISPERWNTLPKSTKDLFYKIHYQSLAGREKPRLGYYKEFNLFVC